MDLTNRFTDRARQAMQVAERAARRFGHYAIDTEHLLLALISDKTGKAVEVLKHAGVDEKDVEARIECTAQYASSNQLDESERLKPTARAQLAIDYATDEAYKLDHDYVGSEHLLIGLLREGTGLAAEILREFALTLPILRKEAASIIAIEAESRRPPPPTDADRQFFLALYKSAVAFYKPKIEQRTGTQLCDILVWDFASLPEHVLANHRAKLSAGRESLFKRFFRRHSIGRLSEVIQPIYSQRATECSAAYYRGAIYVSFAGSTAHDYTFASTTVHEISHALWEKIAEEELEAGRVKAQMAGAAELWKYLLFVEGFATYAAHVWFLDIYPQQIREQIRQCRPRRPDLPHTHGLRHVKWLVQRLGPEVFLEIPKKWRTLPEPESG